MKKNVLLLFVVLTTTSLFAQKTAFGAKVGLNLARSSEKMPDGYSMSNRVGFVGGFYFNFRIKDKISFQPEMLYSAQGAIGESTGNPETTVIFDYLTIPLMLQYTLVEGLYIQAGPQIGILLVDQIKSNGRKIDYSEGLNTLNAFYPGHSLSTFDYGLNFGLGYKTKIGLNFDARYNLGLKDILTGPTVEDNRHRVLQFTIGYDIIKNSK